MFCCPILEKIFNSIFIHSRFIILRRNVEPKRKGTKKAEPKKNAGYTMMDLMMRTMTMLFAVVKDFWIDMRLIP